MGDSQMSNTDWSKVTIDDEFSAENTPTPDPKPIRQAPSQSSPSTGLPDFPDINELAAAQGPPASTNPQVPASPQGSTSPVSSHPTNPRHVTIDYSARNMQGLPEINENPVLNPMGGRNAQGSPVNAGSVRLNQSQMDVANRVVQSFTERGYTPEAAYGAASNFLRESSLNPVAWGDNGTSFGLGQWRGDRLRKLVNLARSKGESTPSIDTQLEFTHMELAGSESKAGAALKNARSEREAADLLMVHYERPAEVVLNKSPLVGGGLGGNASSGALIDPHRKDRVRNILGYDPWGEIDTTPPLTDWDKTIADDPDVRKNFNFFDGLGAILQGVFVEAPKEAIAAGLSGYRGGEIGKTPWLDQWIKERREAHDTWVKKWGLDDNSTFLGIPAEHLMNLPKSLGFSGIAAIAGLGAGAAGTLAGGPIGGYAAGMAGSGAAAYRMAADGFLDQLYQAINTESMNVRGRGVSPEEWTRIAEHYQDSARNYGLWEAIPEAIGNAISFGVITGTIKGFLGKEFVQQGMLKGLIKGGEKLGEMYAGELATETVTEMGQGYEESKIGLRDHAPGLGEAASNVFWPTVLLTTITGGMGMGAKYAWDKFKGPQPVQPDPTDQPVDGQQAGVPAVQSGVPAVQGGLPAIQSGVPATQAGVPGFPNRQVIRPQPIPRDTPIDMLSGEPLQGLPSGQDFETQGEPYGPPSPTRPTPPPTQQIPPFQNFQTVGQPYGPIGDSLYRENPLQGQPGQFDQPQIGMRGPYPMIPADAGIPQESFDAITVPPPVRRQLPAPQQPQQAQAQPQVPSPSPDQNAAISAQIDEAAHDAATSPFNVKNDPTDGQKGAGNYQVGHPSPKLLHGLPISIENPKGSIRSGVDKNGKPWKIELKHHYGYVLGTKGRYKDHFDVIIGDHPLSSKAFVVDQIDPDTGKYDEGKGVIGVLSEDEARQTYLANYEPGWQGLGAITEMPVSEFKTWVKDKEKTTKPVKYVEGKTEPVSDIEAIKERVSHYQSEVDRLTRTIGRKKNHPDEIKLRSATQRLREWKDTLADVEGKSSPIDEIEREAKEIADLTAKLKDRAMIYQVDEKERLAKKHGKPLDAYYDLSYSEWSAIRDQQSAPEPSGITEPPRQEPRQEQQAGEVGEAKEDESKKEPKEGEVDLGQNTGRGERGARKQPTKTTTVEETQPEQQPEDSQKSHWLNSIEDKEPVYEALRHFHENAESFWRKSQELAPRGGAIGVGAADFDEVLYATVLDSYRRAITKGSTPQEALRIAQEDGRDAVLKHNARRPKDMTWQRSETAGNSFIEGQHRLFIQRIEKKQPTVTRIEPETQPAEEPTTSAEPQPVESEGDWKAGVRSLKPSDMMAPTTSYVNQYQKGLEWAIRESEPIRGKFTLESADKLKAIKDKAIKIFDDNLKSTGHKNAYWHAAKDGMNYVWSIEWNKAYDNKDQVQPEIPVSAEVKTTPPTKTESSATLAGYGLKLKRTVTKKGTPVWEVSGDTRPYAAQLGKNGAGGKFYIEKKVWSFYGDEDPSSKILAKLPKLEGKKAEPESSSTVKAEKKKKSPASLVFTLKEAVAWRDRIIRPNDTKVVSGSLYKTEHRGNKWSLVEEDTKQAPTIIYDEDQNPHRQETKDMDTVDQMRRDMEERKRAAEEKARERAKEISNPPAVTPSAITPDIISDHRQTILSRLLQSESVVNTAKNNKFDQFLFIAPRIIKDELGKVLDEVMAIDDQDLTATKHILAGFDSSESSGINKEIFSYDFMQLLYDKLERAPLPAKATDKNEKSTDNKDKPITDLSVDDIMAEFDRQAEAVEQGAEEVEAEPEAQRPVEPATIPSSKIPKKDSELTTIEELSERIKSIDGQREKLIAVNNPRDFDEHNRRIAKLTEREGILWKKRAGLIKAQKKEILSSYDDAIQKAEVEIQRKGAVTVDGITAKIVQHSSGEGWDVEITDHGDRRIVTDDSVPSLQRAYTVAIREIKDRLIQKNTEPKSATDETPTPSSKLKEAGSHIQKILDGAKRINAILGEKGALSNEEVDPEKYAQIKPILKEMWDEAVAAGQNVGEFVKLVLESLSAKGRAYLKKFLEEEMSGENSEKSGTEVKPDAGFKDKNIVGYNQYGDILRIDDNTNRYYVSSAGFRISAPTLVSMMGKGVGGGVFSAEQLFKDGRHEFLTKDELDRFKSEEEGKETENADSTTSTEQETGDRGVAEDVPASGLRTDEEGEDAEPGDSGDVQPDVGGIPGVGGGSVEQLDQREDTGNRRGIDAIPDPDSGEVGRDISQVSPGTGRTGRSGSGRRTGQGNVGKAQDYIVPEGGLKREGSWYDTAKRNVDIIELALKIQSENRSVTPEEQELLSKYTGFGASEIRNKLFPIGYVRRNEKPQPLTQIWPNYSIYDKNWQEIAKRLSELPEDWQKTILQSTQYAHYTSEGVTRQMWEAARHMGFTGGKILEPGMGIGNFHMTMPDAFRKNSTYTGIEFDGPTALIAKLLLPKQQVMHDDYTKRKLPKNFFDLAIGNPPFASIPITNDPDYAKHEFSLHDYFFAKTVDLVRPGGLVMFITSRHTMDRQGDKARRYLNDRADLIGAVRLPQMAFQDNAGTSVVTDVLFFRKRKEGETPSEEPWNGHIDLETKDGTVKINEYYGRHPEMILGQVRKTGHTDDRGQRIGGERGYDQPTVISYYDSLSDLDAAFSEAVKKLPGNVFSVATKNAEAIRQAVAEAEFNPKVRREGALYLDDKGKVRRVQQGVGVDLMKVSNIPDGKREWFKDLVKLKELVNTARYDQYTEGEWEASLKALQTAYDKFRKKHGPILDFTTRIVTKKDEDGNDYEVETRSFKNARYWREDYDSALLTQLEKVTEEGDIIKSSFLTERTIGKPTTAEIKTVYDAMAVSLDAIGKLDLNDIATRMDLPESDVIETLGDLVFKGPSGDWLLSDEYLSGDVVKKLEEAKVAAELDPQFERNVEALQKAIPKPLGHSQIRVILGAGWVPDGYVTQFAQEVLGAGSVRYDRRSETWSVVGGNLRSQRQVGQEYGTEDRSPSEILEAVLNGRKIVIKRTERLPGGGERTYTDTTATEAINDIMKKMKDKFSSWIWTDGHRASDLLGIYNRTKNNIATRKFNGDHLTLPGVSLKYRLHPHQKRAIWRIIQTGNTYLGHAVGAGKSLEAICAGMEMKRLGLVNRPWYVVPNHMLEQFSNGFMDAYPLANIMVADKEAFHKDKRKEFIAQATLNSPDAVIITHSAFERIGVKEESVAPIRDQLVNDLTDALDNTEDSDRIRRSSLQRQIEIVERRFDSITGSDKKDVTITFEETGADFLFVDEAHNFRKLDFHTNRKLKGIDPNGSRRAMDLYVKTKYLESKNPGRSHVFMSGTPLTNTIGELYTLMKFFIEDQMDAEGISTFDGWASTFGDSKVILEPNAAGNYENVERFSQFINVPELMSRVRAFMDVLTSGQLGAVVDRPDVEGGKPNIIAIPETPEQTAYRIGPIASRVARSKAWKPSFQQRNNPDPMIAIISEGRKASIDPRFFNPGLPNDVPSKLNRMADDIIDEYHQTKDYEYVELDGKTEAKKGGAQIVFYNLGFGEQMRSNNAFNARDALTKRLVAGGIKRSEIAWFDDADTDPKKERVFKETRAGNIRVLIGSAKKMGTGVNVQKRLTAMNYLDPPWYPADFEQPQGRIIRQGNQNKMVKIRLYATKGSYDEQMWSTVARKQKNIDQAFIGDDTLRNIDDISEASHYEMAAALASGDQRVLQLAGLNQDIDRYDRLAVAHQESQRSIAESLDSLNRYKIPYQKRRIAELKLAKEATSGEYEFFTEGKVGSQSFEKKERNEFGGAIKEAYKTAITDFAATLKKNSKGGWKIAGTIGKVNGKYSLRVNVNSSGQSIWNAQLEMGVGPAWFEVHAGDMNENTSESGLVTKMINVVNRLDQMIREAENILTEHQTEAKRLDKVYGAPFEYEQERAEKIAEKHRLEADLVAEGQASSSPTDNAPPEGVIASSESDTVLASSMAGLSPEGKEGQLGFLANRLESKIDTRDVDRLISSIRNESGRAVILEDLASYALSLMEKGVDSFVKFKEAARTALGDLYEKVKELLMVAWGKAKEMTGKAKEIYRDSGLGDETGAVGNLGKKEDIGQAANQDGQSEQGEKITETPEFRAWFKDSKVVDEDGEPLVVYHGTVSDFSEFDFGKLGEESGHPTSILGFFFTPDIGIANDVVTPELGGIRKNASIMPVYLNIKNPYRITAEQFTRIYDKNEETWDANTSKAMINLRAVVERKGYDGIIVSKNLFRGMDELNADTYIAFSPTQIKSATGNTGSFSATNPDIRFSMRDDGGVQGISAKRLRNFIADITKKWKNAPIINVVQSVRDLPVNYKEIVEAQTGDIEAFFDPATNTVHFIADNLGSIDRVQRVLLHEVVGHHGLSAILAPSKLKPFLNQVFMAYGKSGLQSIADEYGYDLSTEEGRLKAAEEKLAELVEMGDKPSLLNRLMALIREALRSIGFTMELNDLDIYQVLYRAGRYVRDGHEGGGFRFSFPPSIQSSSLKATEMATFRKWFGKSVVKDEDGTPKIVYRGDSITPDRTVMEPRQGGDLGSGTYFAEEHHVAEEFTEGTDKAHVKQYYLKLENPLNLMDRNLKDNPSMKNILKAMPEGSNKALLNDWLDGKLDVKHAYGFLARVTSNTMDTFNRFLAGYGFDGVMDRGVRGVSDGEWQYVVFSPNQVKSATDNTGAFDPNNPDVRFSIKNTPKNPSTYQKDHVAFDYKSGFDWSNEGLSKLATKVYTKVIDAEYPAIKLAKEIGGEPAAKFISDLVDRVRARSSIAESNLMEGLTHLDNNGSPVSYGQSLH
jgi:N12 class adenine-specific DNA methylase